MLMGKEASCILVVLQLNSAMGIACAFVMPDLRNFVLQAERCPDCGAGFTTVQELIRHSESVHQHQHSRPQPVQRHQPDSCPHCGKMFPDAVALVRHVEHSHGDRAQCVLC